MKRPLQSLAMKKCYASGYRNPMTGRQPNEKQLAALKLGRLGGEIGKAYKEKIKGDNHWTRRKGFSKKTRRRMSASRKKLFKEGKLLHTKLYLKGHLNPSSGRLQSETAKAKNSIKHKELWATKEYAGKCIKGFHVRPTKPELTMMFLLNFFGLNNFIYNGDFSAGVTISGRIPDFIDAENKKVIEVFGSYWHNRAGMQKSRSEAETVRHYKENGYDCVVIWEHDLKGLFG